MSTSIVTPEKISDYGFVMHMSSNNSDMYLTSLRDVERLHIGNNLVPWESNVSAIQIQDNRVGVGMNVSDGFSLSVTDSFAVNYSSNEPFVTMESGNLRVFDRTEGTQQVMISAKNGMIQCTNGVFTTLRTTDLSSTTPETDGFSLCRIVEFSDDNNALNDNVVFLTVQNCFPVKSGNILLINDNFMALVINKVVVSGFENIDRICLLKINFETDDFVASIKEVNAIYKLISIEDKILPKALLTYQLHECFVVQKNSDEIVIRCKTDNIFALHTLKQQHATDSQAMLGISYESTAFSFIIARLVSMDTALSDGFLQLAFSIMTDNFLALPDQFENDTLYLLPDVKDLVTAPKYQVFTAKEIEYLADDELLLHFDESLPDEVINSLSDCVSLTIEGRDYTIQPIPQNAPLDNYISYQDNTLKVALANGNNLDICIGWDMNCGIYADFVGLPVQIINQTRLDAGMYVWQVLLQDVRFVSQMRQLQEKHVIVYDNVSVYVVYIRLVVNDTNIIFQISPDWHPGNESISRLVYIRPLRMAYMFGVKQRLKLMSLECENDIKCDRLDVINDVNSGRLNIVSGSNIDNVQTFSFSGPDVFVMGDSRVMSYRNVFPRVSDSTYVSISKRVVIENSDNNGEEIPIHVLDVNSDGVSIKTHGSIVCLGGVHVPSDKRLKKNIKPLSSLKSLKRISNLGVSTYESIVGRREIGVMAQDLLLDSVTGLAVSSRDDKMLSVRYDMMTALSICAMKQLSNILIWRKRRRPCRPRSNTQNRRMKYEMEKRLLSTSS